LEFGAVGFCGGKRTGEPGEKPFEQPTYGAGPESNPGHIGGRRTLPPLRYASSPSAPNVMVATEENYSVRLKTEARKCQ